MRAALYCRLSREDGGDGESESIRNQKALLLAYAREQGYQVSAVYADEDYSGADRDRPAFNRMLAAAARGEFEVLLVKSQSRFARDMELVEKYLHGLFPLWGVRFIAVVDRADTADPANKKARQINGLVNEWYLEDLSGSVRAVLDQKRQAGQYIAAFPLYGYRKDPADHNRLLPDPATAPTLRRIFALYLEGLGTSRIARLLNQEGVPCPGQRLRELGGAGRGEGWSKSTVHRLLTNPTYKGELEQGRHRRVSYKSRRTVWLPRSAWVRAPGACEPLVDPDRFDRVQAMLHARARGGGRGQVAPLAGRVVCAVCGRPMEQTVSGRGTRYFRCRAAQKGLCAGQPYLPAAPLEALTARRLRAHLGARLAGAEALAPLPEEPDQALRQQEEHLAREQARRQAALEQLYLDRCAGAVGEEPFAQLADRLARSAEELARRREALAARRAALPDAGARRQAARAWLRRTAALASPDRELVCLALERIAVHPPGAQGRLLEFFWRF